jgi:membrane associated rhomboid family serine protease
MFIPIGDDNSRRRTFPFVVWFFVGLNAYVWYLQQTLGEPFMASYAAVPFELSHGVDLTHSQYLSIHGERLEIPQGPGPHPIYLTAFYSMFMHGSWLHIIGNMLYLLIFGDQIEDEMGHFKFLMFYLIAGLAAMGLQVWMEPNSIIPCIGASGAIAGVLGAYLVLHPRNRVHVIIYNRITQVPAVIVLGMWGIAQIMGQASSQQEGGGVAYMAHIGGLVAGLIAGAWMRIRGY